MGYLLGYLRNICGICVGIEWDIKARDSLAHVPAIQPQNILKPPSISSITKHGGTTKHFPNNDQFLVDSTLSTSPQTIAIERFVCIRVSC